MAATKLSTYQAAIRYLADARLALITDDVETRYALDDAWDSAVGFVLRQAPWRFALKTALLIATGAPLAGFSNAFSRPTDWLRTHALFVLSGAMECPLDIREQGIKYSSNFAGNNYIRYVSSDYADPALASNPWSEHFAQAVAAYLAFSVADRVTGEHGASGRMSQLFSSLLPEAIAHDALPENPWLPYQLDGRFYRASRFVLGQGFWHFAMPPPATPVNGGTAASGYTQCFVQPADLLRTQALFLASAGREFPFDVREHDTHWSTNVTGIKVRYVSTAGLDATLWPEGFSKAVMAFLVAQSTEGQGKEAAVGLYGALLREAQEAYCDPPNPWLLAQLDGSFLRIARTMIDEGYWRFARKTVAISVIAGAGSGGFANAFALPADLSRTRSLFLLTAEGRRVPFAIREHAGQWHANIASFYAEYLSSILAMDATQWPDHYMRAVLRQIHYDQSTRRDTSGGYAQVPPETAQAAAAWKDALADTVDSEADSADPWLSHQLDGSFDRAVPVVLNKGFWWWALKETVIEAGSQLTSDPDRGFPYRYALPSDWFRTHSLFVAWDGQECPINIRESASDWSTDSDNFVARYVSTAALNPLTWPESVAKAVLAYLDWQAASDHAHENTPASAKDQVEGAEYDRLLAEAIALHSRPPDDWLRFQLDGRYQLAVKMLLEKGRWRFAVKSISLTESSDPLPAEEATGAVSNSYALRFILPNDHLKTIWVYYLWSSGLTATREDLDFREEGGALHANRTPITLRYVSRLGLNSTLWSSHFRDACLAWLEHVETRADPKMVNIAAAKLKLFEAACEEAEDLDDGRDMPPVVNVGRFVAGRYSRQSRGRGNTWPVWR